MPSLSPPTRSYRAGNDLNPQPLPPGEDGLNPQPLPPAEKAITLEAFAETVTRGVLRAVEAQQAPGEIQTTAAPRVLPSRIIMGWILDPILGLSPGEVGGPQQVQSQRVHGPDGPPPAPQPPPGTPPPRPEPHPE